MVTFELEQVEPLNTAMVQDNGDLVQQCKLVIKISGITSNDKNVIDMTSFVVTNDVVADDPFPFKKAWEHIKNVLAPEFVVNNYTAL
jgi:hypothetical protein